MGGFLTLLAVVASHRRTAATEKVVSTAQDQRVAGAPLAGGEASENSGGSNSDAASPELWAYTARPGNADKVESLMATPSQDIHYVKIDAALVGGSDSPLAQKGQRVEITLPNGAVVPVTIQETQSLGANRYTSEGTIEGSEEGRAVFAYNDGEMSAVIDNLELGSWQVRSIGGSFAQVFQLDPALLPPCGATDEHHVGSHGSHGLAESIAASLSGVDDVEDSSASSRSAPAAAGAQVGGSAFSDGWNLASAASWPTISINKSGKAEIRVLVPYSKVVLSSISQSTVNNWIDLALASLNNDLARSKVQAYVTLAGAPAVNYSQEWSGSASRALDDALTRITSSVDGVLDSIHVMRGNAKADIVVFAISRTDTTNSGVGYTMSSPGDAFNAAWGFAAVNFWHMNSGSVFSHEVGHTFGCSHDRGHSYSTSGAKMKGSYSYSYGHRFNGSDGKQYRSIMAYAPGNVVPYFSNPNVWVRGGRTGAPLGGSNEASNALTIHKNAPEISRYSESRAVLRTLRRLSAK